VLRWCRGGSEVHVEMCKEDVAEVQERLFRRFRGVADEQRCCSGGGLGLEVRCIGVQCAGCRCSDADAEQECHRCRGNAGSEVQMQGAEEMHVQRQRCMCRGAQEVHSVAVTFNIWKQCLSHPLNTYIGRIIRQ